MKAFPGLTPRAIDDCPAAALDWLLAIDATATEAQTEGTPSDG